jgi:hypothetical protein
MNAQRLEVHLEELGEHSWNKALLSTLSGSYGSAQYRFVARRPGEHRHASEDQFVGATFPGMRLQDLDDQVEPNAWLDLARQRSARAGRGAGGGRVAPGASDGPALVVVELRRREPRPVGSVSSDPQGAMS